MKNIIFVKAGTFKDSDKVYFSSRSRKKKGITKMKSSTMKRIILGI